MILCLCTEHNVPNWYELVFDVDEFGFLYFWSIINCMEVVSAMHVVILKNFHNYGLKFNKLVYEL